jgi:DNA-binding protein HU-beta
MTKADLVAEVAKKSGLSKKDAEAAMDATFDAMKAAIKKSGAVRYPGFGTFTLKRRKARKGINPQTKQPIQIKASKTVGFKPSQSLKAGL